MTFSAGSCKQLPESQTEAHAGTCELNNPRGLSDRMGKLWGDKGDLIRPPGDWEYPVGDAEIQEQRLPSAQSGCSLIMSENRKRKVRGAAL